MAVQTKTIKQKMSSVKNIGKITKAMEMISVSKMRKSVQKRNASDAYAQYSFNLLENLHVHRKLTHPYLEGREGESHVLMLIVASNKGLCGGYNMNVSKQVAAYMKANPEVTVEAITVGKQAAKIAWRNDIPIRASFTEYSEYFSASEVRSIMYTIFDQFNDNREFGSVVACYTKFISSIQYQPEILQLVPMDITKSKQALHLRKEDSTVADSEEKKHLAEYVFEPGEQEVLDAMVPRLLMTVPYQLLLDATASEHSSRVTAMKNASDNAGELLDELKINYNRARQAAITQEIAEIVGGSSAVSS